MSSPAISTMITMMESLPEPMQERLVEQLKEYLADLQDEFRWEMLFRNRQTSLVAAARRAKQQIAVGQATPMDYDMNAFLTARETKFLEET